jgi:hypothetical protein
MEATALSMDPIPAKADGGHKIGQTQVRSTFTTLPALGCKASYDGEYPAAGNDPKRSAQQPVRRGPAFFGAARRCGTYRLFVFAINGLRLGDGGGS